MLNNYASYFRALTCMKVMGFNKEKLSKWILGGVKVNNTYYKIFRWEDCKKQYVCKTQLLSSYGGGGGGVGGGGGEGGSC